jgi:hypothetical protein
MQEMKIKEHIDALLQLKREQVLATINEQPNLNYKQIATLHGMSLSFVETAAKRGGVTRTRGRKPGVNRG